MSDMQAKISSLTPEQRKKLLEQVKKKRGEPASVAQPASEGLKRKGMDFSLIFFSGNGSTENASKYDLLVESARFADRHGFAAVTTPERHFQPVAQEIATRPRDRLSTTAHSSTMRIGSWSGKITLPARI